MTDGIEGDTPLQKYHKNRRIVLEAVSKNISGEIASAFQEFMNINLKDINFNEDMKNNGYVIDNVINKYFRMIAPNGTIKGLAGGVGEILKKRIIERIQNKGE